MDKLVMTEGLNDVWFLSLLHNKYSDHDRFDYFDNESDGGITESKRISQHAIDTNYKFLYKAEGGRPNISIIFSDVAQSLVGMDIETFMLVDLDGGDTSELYEELNKYLTIDYKNYSSIVEINRSSNEQMYILDTVLKNDSRNNMPVKIFAFYSDLEDVTGIIHGEERSSKMRKIWTYINDNDSVCDDMAAELYQ